MNETFKAGWGVSVILHTPINGLICYCGEIRTVDQIGIRITTMDWIAGLPVGMDWWFPWVGIAAIEVATDAHTGWDPGRTQQRAQSYHFGEVPE
jgi:hypothetical protein